jgi:hypothetical protein
MRKLAYSASKKTLQNPNKNAHFCALRGPKTKPLSSQPAIAKLPKQGLFWKFITPPDGGDALDFLLLLRGFLGFLLSHFSLLARVDVKLCVPWREESTTFSRSYGKTRAITCYDRFRGIDATIFALCVKIDRDLCTCAKKLSGKFIPPSLHLLCTKNVLRRKHSPFLA